MRKQPPASVAQAVRKLVSESGVSQEKFAQAAGVNSATLGRIMNGRTYPIDKSLVGIAEAAGLPRDALLRLRDHGEPLPDPAPRNADDVVEQLQQAVLEHSRQLDRHQEALDRIAEMVRMLAEQRDR